jgi:nitroimidazol reductase NimA-like FMN-containing flavoprotein (pyridoxamine 5'-phosphate oxidase superfamily)
VRRSDREITEQSEIEAIISRARVCRLALSDGASPYVVPMNFGYHDGVLYFHSAPSGRKIDIIRRNASVCFEMDVDCEVVEGAAPCDWTTRYRSVVGFGTAAIIEDPAEKRFGLAVIVEQYADRRFEVPEETARRTAVIKVTIDRMTGKRSD